MSCFGTLKMASAVPCFRHRMDNVLIIEKEKLGCCVEHYRQHLGSWGLHGRRSQITLGRKQVGPASSETGVGSS